MLPVGPWLLKALLLTTYTVNRLTVDNNVVILSHGGRVRGTIMRSEEGRPFFAFKGIPYAEPPVGQLRFKAPVAKKSWSEEFDATKEGPTCCQVDLMFKPGEFVGQEDCLTINVYTPQLPQKGMTHYKRDVLVYIHGGGFMIGSATTMFVPPKRVMDEGNILVAMNYRLDALGFLSTGDEGSPGNYGLLDQSLALQWVHDNIEAFSGNPESVTIFGHSAGAGSVSLHLVSPLSKGLFHRAFPMSGSALAPWAFDAAPLRWAKYLASQVGCPESPSSAMVDCFRAKPAQEFVRGMGYYMGVLSVPLPFGPTLDGHFLQEPPFQTFFHNPERLNKVPVMSGITEAEGSGFLHWMKLFRPNATVATDEFVNFALNTTISGQFPDLMEQIKQYYELSSPEDEMDEEILTRKLIRILSDGLFKMDHYLEVKALAAAGAPAYAYSYEFVVDNRNPMFGVFKKYGVNHGEDYIMYFDVKQFGYSIFGKRERKMSKLLLSILTNFAKTGKPVPNDQFQPIWEASTPNQINILKFNDTLSLQEYNPDNPDQLFWINIKEEIQKRKTLVK